MQYLFGMHPVIEALKAGRRFDKVLLKTGLEGSQFKELMTLINEKEIPYQWVPVERLNRSVRGAHQGVIAYLTQIDYVDIETRRRQRRPQPRRHCAYARMCWRTGYNRAGKGRRSHKRRRGKGIGRRAYEDRHLPRPESASRCLLPETERIPHRGRY